MEGMLFSWKCTIFDVFHVFSHGFFDRFRQREVFFDE
ncbi:uncharacterized protein METZ01_LOCUS434966, partial [marine metagenome]